MPKPDVGDVDVPIPYVLSPWLSDSWKHAPTCCCHLDIDGDLVVCKECGTIYVTISEIAEWVKGIL